MALHLRQHDVQLDDVAQQVLAERGEQLPQETMDGFGEHVRAAAGTADDLVAGHIGVGDAGDALVGPREVAEAVSKHALERLDQ